ncbi:hypothetical protein DXA06_23070 [Bacteroides ovatus]|jgi:hypothetical protein|uniref:hypothetical protein n=2 Tax=Bacteroides TaxID=816 RepID=UPI000E476F29|nr:hypothetical protein [Bacteroides ovatus]RGR79763.1 hypothetical protein DWY24_20395 [Bacteroides ovatus]RGZ09699.1 hypothetical protein DXA06_23070 [Bacteroides ovatus]RJU22938.1 hypothetical protein DXA05_25860 [Bacteroides sp. AM54-2NS]
MGFWNEFKKDMHIAKEQRQCARFLQQILMMLEDETYANFTPTQGMNFFKELKIAYINYTYRIQEYNITSLTIKDKQYDVKEYDVIIKAKIRNLCKKYGINDERFKE